MKKKIFLMLTLIFTSEHSVFAANECIAITNNSPIAVEFDSLVSPGDSYTVQPKASATLSRDHMAGACSGTDSCAVTVAYVDHSGFSIIYDLPPGTHIVYHGTYQYDLNKNAHVPCK